MKTEEKVVKEQMASSEKMVKKPEVAKKVMSEKDEYITINFSGLSKGLTMPVAIIISALILAIGIGSGIYFGLRAQGTSTTTTGTNTTATPTGTGDPLALSNFPEATVTIGNSAVKGELKPGKVVMVEFSDLMCVFCRQFTAGYDVQTGQKLGSAYAQVVSEYIDKGQVAMVYRHFPLPIHEPAATKASLMAECVRQVSGDGKFYSFVDQFFEQLDKITKSTASGLEMDQSIVESIISNIGSDKSKVLSCYNAKSTQNAINADVADAQALSTKLVSEGKIQGLGTPSFVIGKLQSDGKTVVGRLVPGAYPFQAFQTVIEAVK